VNSRLISLKSKTKQKTKTPDTKCFYPLPPSFLAFFCLALVSEIAVVCNCIATLKNHSNLNELKALHAGANTKAEFMNTCCAGSKRPEKEHRRWKTKA